MVSVGHFQDLKEGVEWVKVRPDHVWVGLENGMGCTGSPSFAITD